MSDLNVNYNLPPGSIIVVGPNGRFSLRVKDGQIDHFRMVSCDIIDADAEVSPHQVPFVADVWTQLRDGGEMMPRALTDAQRSNAPLPSDLPQPRRKWWQVWR